MAIRVGGQDHAAPFASFLQPRLRDIHRRTTGVASVRGRRAKSSFNDTDAKRPTLAQRSSEARTTVGAIVGEYDNADEGWRNRPPQLIALLGERPESGLQALFFISDGYGDNEAEPDAPDKT